MTYGGGRGKGGEDGVGGEGGGGIKTPSGQSTVWDPGDEWRGDGGGGGGGIEPTSGQSTPERLQTREVDQENGDHVDRWTGGMG